MGYCHNGGYVVAARYRVPANPTETGEWSETSPVGCSKIRCGGCGVEVRQAPGFAFAKRTRQKATIYETEDWSKLGFLKPDKDTRLYACRCAVHAEINWNLLGDTDSNKLMTPYSWGCGGHPDGPDRAGSRGGL
jgi:hypothetical protein